MQWVDRHFSQKAMSHLRMERAVVVNGSDGQQWFKVPAKNCRVFNGYRDWELRWHGTRFRELCTILEEGGRFRPGERQANRAGRLDSNGELVNPGVWVAIQSKAEEYALQKELTLGNVKVQVMCELRCRELHQHRPKKKPGRPRGPTITWWSTDYETGLVLTSVMFKIRQM
eukprot:5968441-Karenia_brevis.AAC.1